jgi:hypothetical protein
VNARFIDLYYLSHRLGFIVVIHSILLSDNSKGDSITVKYVKEMVRYQFAFNLLSIVSGQYSDEILSIFNSRIPNRFEIYSFIAMLKLEN